MRKKVLTAVVFLLALAFFVYANFFSAVQIHSLDESAAVTAPPSRFTEITASESVISVDGKLLDVYSGKALEMTMDGALSETEDASLKPGECFT